MITIGLAAAIAFSPVPELRDWPSAGGFDIVQLEESCAMETTYAMPGRSPIKLTIVTGGDRTNLAMTSMDWSAREGETYDLRFSLGGWAYTGPVTGVVSGYTDKGFVASLGSDFLDVFAAAPALYVTRGEAVVGNLSLRGTAAGVSVLRRCARYVADANAAQQARERRIDYIAPDPFAEAEGSTVADAQERSPVMTDIRWARQPQPDFPERAMERGIKTGNVTLGCMANANGALTNCSIISETPAGAGFGQAALRAVRSARLSAVTVDATAPGETLRVPVAFVID